jgi:hypothetical protein
VIEELPFDNVADCGIISFNAFVCFVMFSCSFLTSQSVVTKLFVFHRGQLYGRLLQWLGVSNARLFACVHCDWRLCGAGAMRGWPTPVSVLHWHFLRLSDVHWLRGVRVIACESSLCEWHPQRSFSLSDVLWLSQCDDSWLILRAVSLFYVFSRFFTIEFRDRSSWQGHFVLTYEY